MKKILSLLLVFSMILSGTCTIYAADLKPEANMQSVKPISISNEVVSMLSEIPIYLTYINNNNVANIDSIKASASLEINEATKDGYNNLNKDTKNEQLHITKNAYEIVEVEKSSKADVINNPLFSGTFARIQELVEQGTKVNYVNIFIKEPNAMAASNDPNDPAYWEANCQYLGTYNSYKFLYLESAANVESSWVTPGNISASLKWNEIAKKTLEAVLDHYVKGAFYKTVKAVASGLSTFFDFVDTPLSITYSSSEGYLKAKVSGDLYLRTVIIQDRLDRVSGYAYYNWGTTQQFKANLKIDAKWPTSVRPGGTYNYTTATHTFSAQYSNTPGFYGNSTLYSSILSLYQNTIGYFTHDERIDIYSIVAKLLS